MAEIKDSTEPAMKTRAPYPRLGSAPNASWIECDGMVHAAGMGTCGMVHAAAQQHRHTWLARKTETETETENTERERAQQQQQQHTSHGHQSATTIPMKGRTVICQLVLSAAGPCTHGLLYAQLLHGCTHSVMAARVFWCVHALPLCCNNADTVPQYFQLHPRGRRSAIRSAREEEAIKGSVCHYFQGVKHSEDANVPLLPRDPAQRGRRCGERIPRAYMRRWRGRR